MAITFEISGTWDGLRNALNQSKKAFSDTAKAVEAEGVSIESVFERMKSAALGITAAFSAKEFIKNMVQVRGQFQQLEVAFATMMGSAEKADALMEQLVKTAATTPFDLQGVAAGAKSLMAYGTAAENVNEMLVRLGDIAAGMSIPLNDLVYLYGTTMNQGRMFTQDLRQFQGRGIPIAEELAKVMNVTKDAIPQLVTAGKVTADVFHKAIVSMTEEGSRFGGLMEAQSKTITGQISNIEDAVDMMFNDLGKKSEGVINTALGSIAMLVEHYETIGKIIISVASAYGAYKGALLAVVAVQRAMNVAGSVSAFLSLAKSVTTAKDAMALFNLVTKANPIGLVVSAVAAAATAFALFGNKASSAEKMENQFNEATAKATAKVKALSATLDSASKTSKVAKDAAKELKDIAEEYGIKLSDEAKKIGNETKLTEELVAKKEELIDAISREAIERERANQQKHIEDDYAAKIQEAREEFVDSLSDQFSSNAKGIMSQLITDNDLERIGRVEAEIRRLRQTHGEYSVEVASKERERAAMTDALVKKLWDYSAQLGKTEGDEARYADAASNVKEAVIGLLRATNESTVAQENASTALAQATLATTGQIRVQDAAKVSCESLTSITNSLITLWNSENHMMLKIHYDDSEIPQWMKGLTDEQLAKSLVARQNAVMGNKQVKYGSRTFGRDDQTIKEMGMLQSEQKRRNAAKNKPAPSATPTATKPKKSKRTKTEKTSTWNQAHADADAKEMMEEWKEGIIDLLSDIQQDITDASIEILDESTEKTLQKLQEDENKQIDAIMKQRRDLIEKRKELDKKLWEKSAEKNDQYNFKPKSDAEYVAMIEAEAPGLLGAFTKRIRQITENTKKQRAEIAKQEAESMREYLKEYGDYQQQRQAITEEYDEKIRMAQTEGEKMMLGKQKESALRQVDERFGVVTQAMADLFADASKKSVNAIQSIIDKYEVLVKYMEGNKGTATQDELSKFGLSQDAIDRILRGEISIKELTDRLKELKGELANRSPYQPFVSNMTAIIKQLKEAKNAADVGTAISSMTNSINDFLPAVKEFGADMANIFGADDSKLQGVLDSLGGLSTAGGGVGQIMSGDVVGGVMNTVKGISQMVDALDGLFGADYSSYERMVEEYDNLISVWDELIEKKKQYISESYGAEAANAGREAERLLANEMEAWRTLGKERTAAGASAGSHSIGYRVRERMNAEDWAGVQRAIGTTDLGGRLDKLYDLTSEQLQRLKEESPSFWAKLDGDMRNYLQNIIDREDKLEEIQDKVKEQLTNTTFDSVKDSFLSALSDMDKSASDFSQDFTKYLFDAVMNAQVGEMLDKELRGWYDDFSRYMESGAGELTDAEMEALRTTWDGIVKKGVEMRDAISAATGYTGSSSEGSATYNAAKSFTQEQGDILNGRLTAIQIHTAEGNAIGRQIAASLQSMASVVSSMTEANTAVLEMRNMMIYTNSHLEDLVRYAKATYNDFGMKLDNVINNLNTKL